MSGEQGASILGSALHLPKRPRRADYMFMLPGARSSSSPPIPSGEVWTIADLDHVERDGRRYEVLHGELLVTPPPSVSHQWCATMLARLLGNWCSEHAAWSVLAPAGVFISETSWLEPDIAVYPVPHSPGLTWRDMPPPMLVVEVLSDSTRVRDRHHKRPALLAHGVGEVWLVDTNARSVERWTSGSEFPESNRDGISWAPIAGAAALELSTEAIFG